MTLLLINRQAFIYGLEFQDPGRFSLFRIGDCDCLWPNPGIFGTENW